MDRKRTLGLAALFILAVGTVSLGKSGAEFGVFGTYLDSKDFGDGFGGGLKLEMNPINWLAVDARVSYVRFDDLGNARVKVDMVPIEITGLLNLPLADERIVPYAGVGVGYYFIDPDKGSLDNNVGFFPLLGLEIGDPSCSLMVEARWLFLQSDVDRAEAEFQHLSKAKVDSIGINLGLIARF